jgi:1,4-alpha-glucan branching enzyme
MLTKEVLEDGKMRVTFRVSRHVWADKIALVGDFNGWDTNRHFLQQTADEADWHIALVLDVGKSYHFRYLVDDREWMEDDHADGYEPNPFGDMNSVVRT